MDRFEVHLENGGSGRLSARSFAEVEQATQIASPHSRVMKITRLDGLPEEAHARHSDPSTSRAAAKSVIIGDAHHQVLAVFRHIREQFGSNMPRTDEDLVRAYQARVGWRFRGDVSEVVIEPRSESGIRSRRAELSNAGYLVEGPEGLSRTGRRARTWTLPGGQFPHTLD